MKKQTFWSIKNIIIIGLFIILIIMYLYPYMIDYVMCHYSSLHNFSNEPSERGTFGDMYGALNSFLSGLAVLGIVLTLFWDKKLKNDELEHVKFEKNNIEISKLIYLRNLIQLSYLSTVTLKNRLITILDLVDKDFSELPTWEVDINFENLKTINRTINQEEYFFAYRNQISGNSILDTFSACKHIEEFEKIQRNNLNLEKEKNHLRKVEYVDSQQLIFENYKQLINNSNNQNAKTFFISFENEYKKQDIVSFNLSLTHQFIGQSLHRLSQYISLPFFEENCFLLRDLAHKNWVINESILSQLQKSNFQLNSSIEILENELAIFEKLKAKFENI